MNEEDLVVISKKLRKYNSYKGEISPSVPNVLERNFHADRPNEKWLTDITEFSLPAGKVYLSPIVDCFDGMLPAWTIGTAPDAALVNSMLDILIVVSSSNAIPLIRYPVALRNVLLLLPVFYGDNYLEIKSKIILLNETYKIFNNFEFTKDPLIAFCDSAKKFNFEKKVLSCYEEMDPKKQWKIYIY